MDLGESGRGSGTDIVDRGFEGMEPIVKGKKPGRGAVRPDKQKTYKNKTYRTDRLRKYLGIEPHKGRNRKTRKVHNAPSEFRRMLSPDMRPKFWKRTKSE